MEFNKVYSEVFNEIHGVAHCSPHFLGLCCCETDHTAI